MIRLRKTSLARNVFLAEFATQYELASTFLRFQEHFESVRFGGRTFSLEQFMDWYASQYGRFSYFEDWTGFNVPSTALDPFLAGKFDPLLDKEKRFLALFEGEREPFYIIGVSKSSSGGDLTHELAHALFFTNANYRAAVSEAMRGYDTRAIERELRQLSYGKRVLKDEVHAYLIAGDRSVPAAAKAAFKLLRKELRSLFRQYGASLIASASRRAPQ